MVGFKLGITMTRGWPRDSWTDAGNTILPISTTSLPPFLRDFNPLHQCCYTPAAKLSAIQVS
jgi:hypothetical protein